LSLPVNVDGSPAVTCAANTCGVTANKVVLNCPDAQCDSVPTGDRVAVYVTKRGNTTYVTYTVDQLPLARLIRDVVPFGDVIADLTEPLLKTIVDSAYPGGNPIPADPSRYRPARLAPPPNELAETASKVPEAVREGLEQVVHRDSDPVPQVEPEIAAPKRKSPAQDGDDKPLTVAEEPGPEAEQPAKDEPTGVDTAEHSVTNEAPADTAPTEDSGDQA